MSFDEKTSVSQAKNEDNFFNHPHIALIYDIILSPLRQNIYYPVMLLVIVLITQ